MSNQDYIRDQRSRQNTTRSPGTTFHAPLTHSIPRLRPTNAASYCSSCGITFRLFRSKYNCHNCGNVTCGRCSDNRAELPNFGYFEPVRLCNLCYNYLKIMGMNRSQLNRLPTKSLREYISAYNLPCHNVIEKDDLINIIMAHRPLEERYEIYYRDHYPIAQPTYTSYENASDIPSNYVHTETQSNSQSRYGYRNTASQPQPRFQSRFQYQHQQSSAQHRQYSTQHHQHSTQHNQHSTQHNQHSTQHRQHSTQHRQPNYQPQPSPPSSRASPLTLQTIIKDKVDVSKLSIKSIKGILNENCIDCSKMIEKSELVERLEILIKWAKHEMSRDIDEISDDGLCRICCDAQSNCLFMNCGHMCTCLDCGKKLQETKNECPICRETIIKIIRVFRA